MDHICVGYKHTRFRMCVYDVLKWLEELLIHFSCQSHRGSLVLIECLVT